MKTLIHFVLFLMLTAGTSLAGQSIIVESKGTASMGDDRTRKQTISHARQNAKKNAAENAAAYIRSETVVKNFVLETDVTQAYSNAVVKIISVIKEEWFKDAQSGESYRIFIKAEVIPRDAPINPTEKAKGEDRTDDPTAPLYVKAWSEKPRYHAKEKMKFYVKGNKPFYLRVVYKDCQGNLTQLLPNPYRTGSYFNGGVLYEIPSGEDAFELEVSPPFGMEKVMVYAGTSPLGNIKLVNARQVYEITEPEQAVSLQTRGVTLKKKTGHNTAPVASQFFETAVEVTTAPD